MHVQIFPTWFYPQKWIELWHRVAALYKPCVIHEAIYNKTHVRGENMKNDAAGTRMQFSCIWGRIAQSCNAHICPNGTHSRTYDIAIAMMYNGVQYNFSYLRWWKSSITTECAEFGGLNLFWGAFTILCMAIKKCPWHLRSFSFANKYRAKYEAEWYWYFIAHVECLFAQSGVKETLRGQLMC